jgi:hypothetical protein
MSATAAASFWTGAAPTGHTLAAPAPKALADPQVHTKAVNARRAAYTGAGASDPVRRTPPPSPVKDEHGFVLPHASALAARKVALTGADSIPAPTLQTCQCGQHVVEVGIANALARRKHAAQLTKIEALRAAGPAGPRSR